ncbi:hypothetical protein RJ639_021506 [Escallonia herrerae]|uniref:RING-type domain-containing protein n=1 Tax=Escallonia herrerae TaxID=1293975 RepID=A0AA89AG28_9ASTE|nr:hypothetical protein RJ639_021506 [Escallonia herrerae]
MKRNPDFPEERTDDEGTENRDEGRGTAENSERVVNEGKREGDRPPEDDCCAICFGDFTIACKTSCGHWFCATCILQFWNYRAALEKCKCPICSRPISKLTPEVSLLVLQEKEVVDVLKGVQRYNRLFQGGACGLMLKALESPLLLKRMFRELMDPDRFRANYYTMRFLAVSSLNDYDTKIYFKACGQFSQYTMPD